MIFVRSLHVLRQDSGNEAEMGGRDTVGAGKHDSSLLSNGVARIHAADILRAHRLFRLPQTSLRHLLPRLPVQSNRHERPQGLHRQVHHGVVGAGGCCRRWWWW